MRKLKHHSMLLLLVPLLNSQPKVIMYSYIVEYFNTPLRIIFNLSACRSPIVVTLAYAPPSMTRRFCFTTHDSRVSRKSLTNTDRPTNLHPFYNFHPLNKREFPSRFERKKEILFLLPEKLK